MIKPVIEGSSKQFFQHDSDSYLMVFKDKLHGNSLSGHISGTGDLRKAFTYYFFRLLEQKGIRTHLIKDLPQSNGLIVQALDPVKIEIIIRNVARGHWVDDHKFPLFNGGEVFDQPLVEFCLKWKKELPNGHIIDDPRISPELAILLNSKTKDPAFRGRLIESLEEAQQLKQMGLAINEVYSTLLLQAGWILEDFKFEVGVHPNESTRQFILIDEISPDCSRIRNQQGCSLTKDLFRQQRPQEEIIQGYRVLKELMEDTYASYK